MSPLSVRTLFALQFAAIKNWFPGTKRIT